MGNFCLLINLINVLYLVSMRVRSEVPDLKSFFQKGLVVFSLKIALIASTTEITAKAK